MFFSVSEFQFIFLSFSLLLFCPDPDSYRDGTGFDQKSNNPDIADKTMGSYPPTGPSRLGPAKFFGTGNCLPPHYPTEIMLEFKLRVFFGSPLGAKYRQPRVRCLVPFSVSGILDVPQPGVVIATIQATSVIEFVWNSKSLNRNVECKSYQENLSLGWSGFLFTPTQTSVIGHPTLGSFNLVVSDRSFQFLIIFLLSNIPNP